jgi:hypothetical protein
VTYIAGARLQRGPLIRGVSSMTYGLCLGVGTPPCYGRKVSDRAAKYAIVLNEIEY